MSFRVHRIDLRRTHEHEDLERALARFEAADIVEIVPIVQPVMMPFGGSARTTHVLVIERTPDG